ADQKSRVSAIARQAVTEIAPLREQHRAARRQAVDLLAGAQIDRGALERLRSDQMRLADQVSQRMVRALADIAEVLTPEQRVRLKERLDRRMSRMGR
ncbi:MAG TPA: periplasmic heavy metal sensor, partial [Quisquiliibacterium sp.]|nr:periplasmic heavy metal sensor [Quisquiliibacterium sp.]